MTRPTDRNAYRKETEATYPWRVDLAGNICRYIDPYFSWCKAQNCDWRHHICSQGKWPNTTQFSRFYFTDKETAERFQAEFGGVIASKSNNR